MNAQSRTASLVAVTLLATAAVAFAPAPLPRRQGPVRDGLAVADLVGTWRATDLYNTPKPERLEPAQNGVATVTVTADRKWIFGREGQTPGYDVRINPATRPAEIDFLNSGSPDPYGRGIIQRKGNTIRVIYNWGAQRPTGWVNQPGGYWDITLVRE